MITELLAKRAYERTKNITIDNIDNLGFDNGFIKYVEDIYKLLQSEEYYSTGVRHLCYACDKAPQDEIVTSLLGQCIKSSRIYLYEDMLRDKGIDISQETGLLDIAQKAFYSLGENISLTKEQKQLYDLFLKKRKLVISAPTSFGKSRIIREIIHNNDYDTIMIIVPTNALLSETYFTFRMDERFSEFDLIFSTHIPPSDNNAIYIFTPEKFDVYTDEYKINYDFFVFDEVYKVDNKDNRSSVYSNCLYKSYREKCDYYLIGPYFNSFSERYLEKTGGYFKKFSTDIVQKTIINYLYDEEVDVSGVTLKPRKGKDTRLKEVIRKVDGQNIVYVSRKDSAETRAKIVSELNDGQKINKNLSELISYIKKNISDKWRLIEYLNKGVAFHHAGVPKYIQTEIVELFNDGVLDAIVCTPTLTEGVNTSAKNVIFYDTTKADIDLTGFEVKNVVGRSGRFGQHFVGRAIFLEQHVEQDNLDQILFPIFDYENISLEDNIQIEFDDLNTRGKKEREFVEKECHQLNIPLSVLKRNKYVSYENQLTLISILRNDYSIRDKLAVESGLPIKHQVDLIIELVYDVLFSESERSDNWSTSNLSRMVKFQIYKNPSIKELIKDYNAVKEDTKIRNVLDLVYRYFEFSLPKYLVAFENIFNFVYSEKLSLAMMVNHLQYGSDKLQDILLTDAGVPKSVIAHISRHLNGVKSIDDIKRRIEKRPYILSGLSKIEIRMLAKRV